ncbi:MAG: T9SS type A sorting domain-containing protein [Bacteroidia bacterium]
MNTKSHTDGSSAQAQITHHLTSLTKAIFLVLALGYSIPVYSQTAPEAPVSATANPTAVCPSSPYSFLKAVSPGNSIRWYKVSTGGTSIGTSASGASFTVNVSVPTTYYAESVTTAGVVSVARTGVTVSVNTAPVITYMPPDVQSTNTGGQCGTIVTYPSASAMGTPAPNIIYSDSSGSNFDGGSTTVIVSAVNVCATSSLSFDVTVNDVESPGMFAPPVMNITAPDGATSVSNVDLGLATAVDNCGILTIYNDAPAVFPGGATTVTWTAVDYNGNRTTSTQMVNVVLTIPNASPVITSITTNDADNIVAQGSSITLSTLWNDEENGGPYTVTIDWRDSSALTVLNGINSHAISVAHIYNKTGVFAPVVTVTDGDGASDTSVFKFIVVYVSGNYSTTCSAKFYAPAGSLVSQPNLSYNNRKVEFGSHCKPACQSGKFDGELELEIDGAHFEFETENVSWDYLAVSGCYLAEFRGSGYAYPNGHHGGCHGGCHNGCNSGSNGGYHYGVLVVQSDKYRNANNKNKVRIKIWNKDNGAIIFDTQMGDPDDALPTTPVSSGSVSVRTPSSCVPRLMNPTYDNNKIADSNDKGFIITTTPNPFISNFSLNFTSENTDKVQVSIYDVVGKLVQNVQDAEPNTQVTIENHLSPGIYYIHAMQGEHVQVIKVVKN